MNRLLAVTGVLLFVAALIAATLIDQLGAPPFDRWITLHVDGWRDPLFWGAVFRTASRVGFATWLVPAIVVWAVIVGVVRRSIWPVLLGLVANPLVTVVNALLKQAFDRPRPSFDQYEATGGFSLPSGHAASSAAFAVAVAFSLAPGPARRVALVLGVLFAVVVGLSRIVLGVHYTTDVAIGWAEGAGLALLVASVTTARAPLPRPNGHAAGFDATR